MVLSFMFVNVLISFDVLSTSVYNEVKMFRFVLNSNLTFDFAYLLFFAVSCLFGVVKHPSLVYAF